MAKIERPIAITIICLLIWILSIFAILVSFGLLGLGLIETLVGKPIEGATLNILALVLVMYAIITIIVTYGLWQMKKWGWKWTIILEVISIVLSLISFDISQLVFIIISLIIITYLWSRKELFK